MAATIQENLVMTAKNDKSATERVKKRKGGVSQSLCKPSN